MLQIYFNGDKNSKGLYKGQKIGDRQKKSARHIERNKKYPAEIQKRTYTMLQIYFNGDKNSEGLYKGQKIGDRQKKSARHIERNKKYPAEILKKRINDSLYRTDSRPVTDTAAESAADSDSLEGPVGRHHRSGYSRRYRNCVAVAEGNRR